MFWDTRNMIVIRRYFFYTQWQVSSALIKPAFGIPDQVQLKHDCTAKEEAWSAPLFLAYEKWDFLTTWLNLIWIPTYFTCKLNIFVLKQHQNLGRRFGTSKMHLRPLPLPLPPRALAAVHSKVGIMLFLIRCWLLLSLWDYVIVLYFVVRYFVSLLVLQSSWWGKESWLLCFVCLPGGSWLLSGSSSRCHGFVCSLWLWYFLIILTYYFYVFPLHESILKEV